MSTAVNENLAVESAQAVNPVEAAIVPTITTLEEMIKSSTLDNYEEILNEISQFTDEVKQEIF